MFVHHGKSRTSRQNLQIASLLSFVAGIVNVAGFFSVARLTTNVTGHFAFFMDELFKLNLWQGFIFFLYIFFFFIGSFTSSFLVELISRKNDVYVYVVPTFIECAILILVAVFGENLIAESPNLIACSLLFAMGLQNSLVTRISNNIVRTTHLTGLFTDLGIEISQLFFYRDAEQLYASIKLRFTIISFFFIGGIMGAVIYLEVGLAVLFLAALSLVVGMIYDNLRIRVKSIARRYVR